MKLSRFRLALAAVVCGAGALHADIVVMKDGKRYEGTIQSETPTSIHMRYKLTAKIWDDKDIPRTEIEQIIKQKPEEVELIELRKLVPTPDLMSAEKYESIIQDKLRPFVNRYPGTKEAEEADKLVTQLQEEKEKVVAGGAKLEGRWLSPEEAKAQSYNIKAYEIYSAMRDKAAAKDYPGAMKEFEKLAPTRSEYFGATTQSGYTMSIYYPKAVEDAVAILTNFQAQVEQLIRDQPTLQKMRDEGLKKLIEPDLSRTKAAIERERDQWKVTYDIERKSSKWFTAYKYDLPSLKVLSTTISTEKLRLKEIDVDKISKLNACVSRIMDAMAKAGKNAEALKAMGEAIVEGESAVSGVSQADQNLYAGAFQGYRQYYMMYHQQLSMQAAQAVATPGAVGPTGGSSAIGGAAAPGMDDRVAAALAAAGGGAAPAQGAAAAQMPATAGAPGAQAPAGAAAAPAVAAPQAPAVAQAPVAAPAPAPVAAVEEEVPQGMSTNTMILIGIGVVVLILVVVLSSGGKKKK